MFISIKLAKRKIQSFPDIELAFVFTTYNDEFYQLHINSSKHGIPQTKEIYIHIL